MFFWEMGTAHDLGAVPSRQGIEAERRQQLHALQKARKILLGKTFRPQAAMGLSQRLRAG